MEEDRQARGPLFGDVAFSIVPSDDILDAQSSGVSRPHWFAESRWAR